jgi:DNA polymerase III delta subunit
MIHILYGNDTKSKNAYIKKLAGNREFFFIMLSKVSKEILYNYAGNIGLFGELPVVVIEGLIYQSDIDLSSADLNILKNSPTIFILLEDKLLARDIKKYDKYAITKSFEQKAVKQIPKVNVFDIADAFGRKDKIKAWMLYREGILSGIEPESISGVLFWKIKTMILNGTKIFDMNSLIGQSGELVSIYHRAHRGECDFVVGLEQFILSSLS